MRSNLTVLTLLLFLSCQQDKKVATEIHPSQLLLPQSSENPYRTIQDIPTPPGYKRNRYPSASFASWLRHTPLKKDKRVFKFDGKLKSNQSAQFAVIDMSVGDKDLQQCADAVMRLRAEYFYFYKQFNQITFSDNNGKIYRYSVPYNRNTFQKYLEQVFSMCGTASLEKQLSAQVSLMDIMPGDVLIHGGFPGHAELVVDVAMNEEGRKIFLLAQSYMPAQDMHILKNPQSEWSPWYLVTDNPEIRTPEYIFSRNALKRW